MKTMRWLLLGSLMLVAACSDGDGNSNANTDADTESDGDPDSNSESHGSTDSVDTSDTASSTDSSSSDTDTDTVTDTDSVTDTDTVTDTDPDTDTDTQCVGQDDFTLCNVETSPDRSYDICIKGACQSPGCGTAACNAPGPRFTIPDTNQRLCYNDTAVMACAASGQGFYGQDAQYGWDMTHLAALRFTRDTSVPDYPVVIDNATTWMWQGCASGLSGDTCATGAGAHYTWENALAYCENLSWGGQSDWRLPDPYELDSIVDLGLFFPAIDTTAFPATPSTWFWSSSTLAGYERYAWFVSFADGQVSDDGKTYPNSVRCVRGGPTTESTTEPTVRYSHNTTVANNPVVSDSATGLEWQGCAGGLSGDLCATGAAAAYTWENALAYCEDLSWGGQSDWRLPNKKELRSIGDESRSSPAIDIVAFPATPSAWFWSSSSYVRDEKVDSAWFVDFDIAFAAGNVKIAARRVRCVRGGR